MEMMFIIFRKFNEFFDTLLGGKEFNEFNFFNLEKLELKFSSRFYFCFLALNFELGHNFFPSQVTTKPTLENQLDQFIKFPAPVLRPIHQFPTFNLQLSFHLRPLNTL